MTDLNIDIYPVDAARWADLEQLFGKKGACGGCWCMYYRLTRKVYEEQKGQANRQALQSLVESGQTPGLLAYAAGEPVGWCSVGPRQAYPLLERSRILKPVDEAPHVWSVVCFYSAKKFRRQGLNRKLLFAAVDFARQHGARIVEGYPVDPKKDAAPDVFMFNGRASTFLEAGFVEVARRSETRPLMRLTLDPTQAERPAHI